MTNTLLLHNFTYFYVAREDPKVCNLVNTPTGFLSKLCMVSSKDTRTTPKELSKACHMEPKTLESQAVDRQEWPAQTEAGLSRFEKKKDRTRWLNERHERRHRETQTTVRPLFVQHFFVQRLFVQSFSSNLIRLG